MGGQIERQQENNACLAYWLSNTVTLLYLLQRNIKPASGGAYNARLRSSPASRCGARPVPAPARRARMHRAGGRGLRHRERVSCTHPEPQAPAGAHHSALPRRCSRGLHQAHASPPTRALTGRLHGALARGGCRCWAAHGGLGQPAISGEGCRTEGNGKQALAPMTHVCAARAPGHKSVPADRARRTSSFFGSKAGTFTSFFSRAGSGHAPGAAPSPMGEASIHGGAAGGFRQARAPRGLRGFLLGFLL